MPCDCHSASIDATSAITQSPISAMIPVCSAIGMKVPGKPHAFARVVPAEQRLGTADLAGGEAQLRLQRQQELAALDGFAERRLGIDLALMLRRQLLAEQAIAPAARVLRPIHGDVGGAHQRFDRSAMFRADRDADRSADVDAVTMKLERLGDGQRDPPGDPLGVGHGRRFRGRRW